MHTYSFALNQGNEQNFDLPLLHYKLWLIWSIFFLLKNNSKIFWFKELLYPFLHKWTAYTVWQIITHTHSFALNQGNEQNFDLSLLHYKRWLIWSKFFSFENWFHEGVEKLKFFETAILDYYFTKNTHLLLLHPHENQSQIMWQNDWDSILMFYMVSSKFLAVRNITLYSVILNQLKML